MQHSALSPKKLTYFIQKKVSQLCKLLLISVLALFGSIVSAGGSCWTYSQISDPIYQSPTPSEVCVKYYDWLKTLTASGMPLKILSTQISESVDAYNVRSGICFWQDNRGLANNYWNYGRVDCSCEDGSLPKHRGCLDSRVISLSTVPQTPPDPRPKGAEGKDGKSTLELIAKVMEGSTPKAGVAVTFKVDVVPMTGGHGHHDANRPKGSVPASGVTDANGEIKLTFRASEVAGSHNITATCDSCSNKTADKKVDVRVPDLAPIAPNPPKNADGSYQYTFTAVDPGHVGSSGGRQRGEYYLTAEAASNLDVLISNFAEEGWGIVGLNDASLNWGGLYDLKNNWSSPHSEHRVGEEIDISFKRAGNVVSTAKQNSFYKKFCEDKKAEVPFSILHHYVLIPHFHVRLANANRCGRTTH